MFKEALEDPRPIEPLCPTLRLPESQLLREIEFRKAENYIEATLTEAGPELNVSNGAWTYSFLHYAINLMLGHFPTYEIKLKLIRLVDQVAEDRRNAR